MKASFRVLVCRFLLVSLSSIALFACGDGSDDKSPKAKTVEIVRFEASSESIENGESTLLSWEVKNATAVEIRDTDGGLISIPPGDDGLPQIAEGEVSVSPAHTTTYILTATGDSGKDTGMVRVEVKGAPSGDEIRVSLQADPSRINAGESTQLHWEAENAQRIILRHGGEILVDDREQLVGSLSVSPARTTTYEIEALGRGESVVASASVEVQPVIESFAILGEGPVRPEIEVELAWSMLGAVEALITSTDGFRYEVPAEDLAQGTLRTAAGNGTFRLTARSGDLEAEKEASIEITSLPVIADLSVGPPVTANEQSPATVTVQWSVAGATEVQLEAIPGGTISPLPAGAESRGSVDYVVTGPTSFRLIASNADGTAERTVHAAVAPFPRILSFQALPQRVGIGESVELSWQTEDAAEISISHSDGTPVPVEPTLLDGSLSLPISFSTELVLTARNELGFAVHAFAEVTVGAPMVLAFEAPLRVVPGASFLLSWEVLGGIELEVSSDAGDVSHCNTTDLSTIAQGFCTVTAPADRDEVTYTIMVKNGLGDFGIRSRTVSTHDGPIIAHFDISEDLATVGESLTLSWIVTEDIDGNPPILELEDSHGKVYDMTDAPATGTVFTEPLQVAGTTSFTLVARTDGSIRKAEATVDVEVVKAPVILLFESDPAFVDADGKNAKLSWETENAVQVELISLKRGGDVLGTLHSTNDPATVPAGNFTAKVEHVAPDFRLVATNRAGAAVVQDLQVGVLPATVVDFRAAPSELIVDGKTTLSWETERATHVTIEPRERWVETADPYIDLSQRPTAIKLFPIGSVSNGEKIIFPDEFVFPFFGVDMRHVIVNGNATFSFTNKVGGGVPNVGFPMPLDNNEGFSSHSYVFLAPWWGSSTSPTAKGMEVYWELMPGIDGIRELVIQVKNFGHQTVADAVFNFNVVLREDGSFDYRYGEMSSPSQPDIARGSLTSVGFHDHFGTYAATLSRLEEFPGGYAWRSFHFPSTYKKLSYEEREDPFIDISKNPSPLAERHVFSSAGGAITLDPLPGDFVIRHAGYERRKLKIWANGVASVLHGFGPSSVGSPRRLIQGLTDPTATNTRGIDYAPYWTPSFPLTPGELWTDIWEENGKRALVVQWKDFELRSPSDPNAPPSALNYEMLLWDDGTIDYRYHLMAHSSDPDLANGKNASIGWQGGHHSTWPGHAPMKGVDLFFDEVVPGGLSGKSYRFYQEPIYPANGSLVVRPRGTVTYELTAHNEHSQHRVSQQVTVHPVSRIVVQAEPEMPRPNQPFHLRWNTVNITSMRIEQDGQIVHSVPTHDLASGSLHFPNGLPAGLYHFEWVGVGAMAQMERAELELGVGEPFEILRFEGPHEVLPVGASATLEWEVENTDSIEIRSGAEIVYSGTDLVGSVPVQPPHSKTYTLTAFSTGRKKTAEHTVRIRTVGIDDLVVSKEEILPYEEVTFSWTQVGPADVKVTYARLQTAEINEPFRDISGTGTKMNWTGTGLNPTIQFPPEFTFPFMGKVYDKVGVAKGVISVGATESTLTTSQPFPFTPPSSSTEGARIGVLWDTTLTYQTGSPRPADSDVFWQYLPATDDEPANLVIQWNNMRATSPSGAVYNLNFQIILYEDGAFDFRYGEMSGTHPTNETFKEQAERRAAGYNANIGFQDFSRTKGSTFSWAGEEIEGGLAWRSFRTNFETVSPLTLNDIYLSDDHTFCIEDEHYRECKTVRVRVLEPGSLAVTELMLNSTEGEDGQWFELRNVGTDAIRLDGKTLRSGGVDHVITTQEPWYLIPGEYAVLAKKNLTDIEVDYVYGNDGFTLGSHNVSGSLEIWIDTMQLGGVSWGSESFPVANQSVELSPTDHKRSPITRDLDGGGSWCPGSFSLPGGMMGSPGKAGVTCNSTHYEVELFSDKPFIDISEIGIRVPGVTSKALASQDEVPGGIGFNFPFYDSVKPASTPLWVHQTGFVTFSPLGDDPTAPWGGSTLQNGPSASPIGSACATNSNHYTCKLLGPNELDGGIMPFWAQARTGGAEFRYLRMEVDGQKVIILQWSNFSVQTSTQSKGRVTYQAQLWENGDIVFAYGDLEPAGLERDVYGLLVYTGIEEAPGRTNAADELTSRYLQIVANEEALVPHSSTLLRKKP